MPLAWLARYFSGRSRRSRYALPVALFAEQQYGKGASVMRATDLELRVLRIVDDVKATRPVEDARVELKAQWPAPDWKTARQIGGHANSCQGESILWIIGLDERASRVTGAVLVELANWWPQVEKHFADLAPDLELNLSVPTADGVVVALLFSALRLPFVVKVPDGGPVDREVPWREGARTLSAKREHLLRLLVPLTLTPRIDLLQARLTLREPSDKPRASWSLELRAYITPADASPVYFPLHDLAASIRFGSAVELPLSRALRVSGNHNLDAISVSPTVATIRQPGLLEVTVTGDSDQNLVGHGLESAFAVSLRDTKGNEYRLRGDMLPDERGPGFATWKYREHRELPQLRSL
jgi:hypothetical protein